MLRALVVALAVVVPLVDLLFAQPPARGPRKVAFLVGVGKYDHKFPSLGTAPENDVAELSKVLTGFEVVTLTGSKPDDDPHRANKKNIEARFKELLEGTGGKRAIRDGDTVLVLLCGHGIEDGGKQPQPFFCPVDARPDDTSTMVPLNNLIRTSEAFGGTNLFLVDACREVPPDANRGARTGIQGKKVSLPDKTAVLFACGSGQLSHQSDKLDKGHGLFTYSVIQTLKGGGRVTWTKLVNGVEESFESDQMKVHITDKRGQQPVEAKGQLGVAELVAAKPDGVLPTADMVPSRPNVLAKRDDVARQPEPGEQLTFEVADGVRMTFCWIPPGNATLGSPNAEEDRMSNESDREYASKGYWLGKHEVTQHEWTKVMGSNPSVFASTSGIEEYRKQVVGMDTSSFPVEQVSWDDICGKDGKGGSGSFLGRVNSHPGSKTAFGRAGRFVLPTDNEWEYAARGGHKDRRPFYWGANLNGAEANVGGPYPDRREANWKTLGRPAPVGSYERKNPHPWGLCDMHGNVSEWCEGMREDAKGKDCYSTRGGTWRHLARLARAGSREARHSSDRQHTIGFRIAFRLD